MWELMKPRRAVVNHRREYWQLWVIGLAYVYDGLVSVLSAGTLVSDLRTHFLFTYWED